MKEKATFLQIDLQNLFYAARNKGHRIDFEKMWEHFHQRDAEFLTDAVVYMIRSPDFDTTKFEAKLKSVGYSLRIKHTIKIMKGKRAIYKKANHDLNMAVECIDRIDTFDKLILMSGDGDFSELCAYLKKRGKEIEIWSFRGCYNTELDRYADRMHMIDDEFFLKKPDDDSISFFSFNWGSPKGLGK